MRRLLLLLLLAGCAGTEAPPPDLLARVQRDCADGNQDACSILQGLPSRAGPAAGPAPRAARRSRSQVQQNADALMQGVDRARATPRVPPAPIKDLGPI